MMASYTGKDRDADSRADSECSDNDEKKFERLNRLKFKLLTCTDISDPENNPISRRDRTVRRVETYKPDDIPATTKSNESASNIEASKESNYSEVKEIQSTPREKYIPKGSYSKLNQLGLQKKYIKGEESSTPVIRQGNNVYPKVPPGSFSKLKEIYSVKANNFNPVRYDFEGRNIKKRTQETRPRSADYSHVESIKPHHPKRATSPNINFPIERTVSSEISKNTSHFRLVDSSNSLILDEKKSSPAQISGTNLSSVGVVSDASIPFETPASTPLTYKKEFSRTSVHSESSVKAKPENCEKAKDTSKEVKYNYTKGLHKMRVQEFEKTSSQLSSDENIRVAKSGPSRERITTMIKDYENYTKNINKRSSSNVFSDSCDNLHELRNKGRHHAAESENFNFEKTSSTSMARTELPKSRTKKASSVSRQKSSEKVESSKDSAVSWSYFKKKSDKPPIANKRFINDNMDTLIDAEINNLSFERISIRSSQQRNFLKDLNERDDVDVNNVILETSDKIWSNLDRVKVDQNKLAELISKNKFEETNENTETKVEVLTGVDRINKISLVISQLPNIIKTQPKIIRSLISNMDDLVLNRNDIENILSVLPTEQEIQLIHDAQTVNPDRRFGDVESFLLELSKISEVKARLEFWLFKMDFSSAEKEIMNKLISLNQALNELKKSATFTAAIRVLQEVEKNVKCLNDPPNPVLGFNLNNLKRLQTVKDSHSNTSILDFVCSIVVGTYSKNDLHSDIPSISRCAKIDWEELKQKIQQAVLNYELARNNLKVILKSNLSLLNSEKQKRSFFEFFTDASEGIALIQIGYNRMMNRFRRFLFSLGYGRDEAANYNVGEFCRMINEFALNYKIAREKVLAEFEKIKNLKKMIGEDDKADIEYHHKYRNKVENQRSRSEQPNKDIFAKLSLASSARKKEDST